MTKTVTEYAYSKINLFLEVTSKRDDGYHGIDSIMQTTSLADTVTVTTTDEAPGNGQITLTCSDPSLPTDSHNLAYKAARLYADAFGIRDQISCRVEKIIPVAAGLAGGSADAAATLAALDKIYRKAGSVSALAKMAKPLGADVPFCVRCGIARTRGIGEIMSACPALPDVHFVIACGEGRKSTAAAYGEIDMLPSRAVQSADGMIEAIADGIGTIGARMYNVFERVTEYPAEIRETMLTCGAAQAMMSGSGPSVFGVFAQAEDAERARDELAALGYRAYTAEPIGERNYW